MSKYSKGCWSHIQGRIGIWDKFGEYEIAKTLNTCFGMSDEEQQANGDLMAASPDMYEALKTSCSIIHNLMRTLNYNNTECYNNYCENCKIYKALHKANGYNKNIDDNYNIANMTDLFYVKEFIQ